MAREPIALAIADQNTPFWVNRVVLTARRSLPVYPDERTYSEPVGMSQRCQMYGPGRALQDKSSKTDERESCNNVSGL
jgi:hypothetical protein